MNYENNMRNICSYIGYVIVIIFVVYLVSRFVSMQTSVLEGLANPFDTKMTNDLTFLELDKTIKGLNENKHNKILIPKYKNDLEDLVIELNENTQLEILMAVYIYGEAIAKNKKKTSQQILEGINKLYTFKLALNSTMKYLDEHKGSN